MSGDDDEPSYDNSHRAFLQAFIARSTFTFAEAKPVLAAIQSAQEEREILTNDITESDFSTYVAVLNAAISPFDLEIRSTTRQAPPSRSTTANGAPSARERIYALVNMTSDPLTQLATVHTADEMAFVQRVLDDMFERYNTPLREIMAVTSTQAANLGRSSGRSQRNSLGTTNSESQCSEKAIGVRQAEEMMKSLVEEGWFEKHREYYTLTPRALMELRGWLLETYNEPPDEEDEGGVERIKLCEACREIVTMGQRCQNRDCNARIHEHCTGSWFRTQRGEKRCPLCRAEWTGRDLIGPQAAINKGRDRSSGLNNGASNGRRGLTGNGRGSRSTGRSGLADDEDDDE